MGSPFTVTKSPGMIRVAKSVMTLRFTFTSPFVINSSTALREPTPESARYLLMRVPCTLEDIDVFFDAVDGLFSSRRLVDTDWFLDCDGFLSVLRRPS